MEKYAPGNIYHEDTMASKYAQYRPLYPASVHDTILSFCDEANTDRQVALDIGCGSGQSIQPLIGKFDKVIGIEPSEALLNYAKEFYPKATFYQMAAEENLMPLIPTSSVNLLSCGNSFHWFQGKENFLTEANRVLTKNGVIAMYVLYDIQLADEALQTFMYQNFFKHFYDCLKIVGSLYQNLNIPWCNRKRISFLTTATAYSAEEFIGLLETFTVWWTQLSDSERQYIDVEFKHRVQSPSNRCSEGGSNKVDVIMKYMLVMGQKV